MAFYSFGRIKIVSRSGVRSAVATAAYHSGTKITNEYDGVTHDHTRKKNVGETYIRMPESAPAAWRDESVPTKERLALIWNNVELTNPAQNAQLARGNYLALPNELTLEQGLECVDTFIEKNCTCVGMGVTYSLHNKPNNRHVDMMYLMREYDENGKPIQKSKKEYLCRKKNGEERYFDAEAFKRLSKASGWEKVYKYQKGAERANLTPSEASESDGWERINKHPVCRTVKVGGWDDPEMAKKWRKSWADILNEKFAELGIDARVDHRSNKERGLSALPTKHEGWGPNREENRQYNTHVREFNREIEELRREAQAELNAIGEQIIDLEKNPQTEKSIAEHEMKHRRSEQCLLAIAGSELFVPKTTSRLKTAIRELRNQFTNMINRWKEFLFGRRSRNSIDEVAISANEAVEGVRNAFETGIDDIIGRAATRSKDTEGRKQREEQEKELD